MRTPITLFLLAFAVRVVLAAAFPDPAYPDSFYYVDVARQLAAGNGFSVDFIWIFPEVGGTIPANPVLPIPSNAHWMPLASLVQVPFIWLLGPTGFASALPFAIGGAFTAPLAWAIARDAGLDGRLAVGAGILAAVPALATPFVAQPDNFGLYEPLIAGALWLTARGLRGSARAYAGAGLLIGLATLARNDGILAGGIVGLAFFYDRIAAWRSRGARTPAIPFWAAVACAGLFVLVLAPWLARQLAVFGSISPSTASGKVLYIRNIGEWNSITTPATLEWLLGQGIGPLVASRVSGLVSAISIFATMIGGVLLVPFMLVGAAGRRRDTTFGPFFGYFIALFAFSTLVSAVHVPGGTFIHSAIALAPHAYVLAILGIRGSVAWAARRRPWNADQATGFFTTAAIAWTVFAGIGTALLVHGGWSAYRDTFLAADAALDRAGAPASDRVMSIDTSGTWYYSGRGGVVLVNDPIETVAEVAAAYDIRWLVIRRSDSVPAVAPALGGNRPPWLGAPILSTGPADAPEMVVLPVCAGSDRTRCGS